MSAYVVRVRHFRSVSVRIQHVRETHNDCNWETFLHTTANPSLEGHLAWPSFIADFQEGQRGLAANDWPQAPLRPSAVCMESSPCQSGENRKEKYRLSMSSSPGGCTIGARSEEHTSELQSRLHLVCRLLLEKKNTRPQRGDSKPGFKENSQ